VARPPAAARLLAAWFGAGYLPIAPGTWGSAGALPLAYPIALVGGGAAVAVAAALLFVAGLWAAGRVLRPGGLKDPGDIVIDEVAGQMIALAPIALDLRYWPLAFVLFRLADVVKPWPASWAERRLPGALGLMTDDVVAGLYAAAGCWLAAWAFGSAPGWGFPGR